jgi:hypothetical protein
MLTRGTRGAAVWIAGPSPAEGLLRAAENTPASARRRVKPGNDELVVDRKISDRDLYN